MRAYRIAQGGRAAGGTVAAAESGLLDARLFIERIRRGATLLVPTAETVLEAGDVVVASGRRDVLVELLGNATAREVEDRELLDIPVATYDVYVTAPGVIGKSLAELVETMPEARGVFVRAILRGGENMPVAPGTV